jgi:glycosyltransferase involved in cell wall biosynthesis
MSSHPPKPALSVVVLCYAAGKQAEPFVREVIDSLERETKDWELVLVANYWEGKADETPDVVRAIAARDPRIRVVAEPKQGMMGWDVRSGLAAATGDVIGFMDGDGQVRAEDLVRTYRTLVAERCDLAMTYRETRGDSAYRSAISRVFNGMFKGLFPGIPLRDVNSKPKVMTRTAYEALNLTSDDWFIDAEIVIQARRRRFAVREIPTTFRALENRASFVKPGALYEFVRNLAVARAREFFE